MQAIFKQTWVAVGKVKVGGNGGRRADGTAERTDGRGFRVEGAEAKVGEGEVGVGGRIGYKREQTLLKAVSLEIADSGLQNILR